MPLLLSLPDLLVDGRQFLSQRNSKPLSEGVGEGKLDSNDLEDVGRDPEHKHCRGHRREQRNRCDRCHPRPQTKTSRLHIHVSSSILDDGQPSQRRDHRQEHRCVCIHQIGKPQHPCGFQLWLDQRGIENRCEPREHEWRHEDRNEPHRQGTTAMLFKQREQCA